MSDKKERKEYLIIIQKPTPFFYTEIKSSDKWVTSEVKLGKETGPKIRALIDKYRPLDGMEWDGMG